MVTKNRVKKHKRKTAHGVIFVKSHKRKVSPSVFEGSIRKYVLIIEFLF